MRFFTPHVYALIKSSQTTYQAWVKTSQTFEIPMQ